MKTLAFIIISIVVQIFTISVAVVQGIGDAQSLGEIDHNKNFRRRMFIAIPVSLVFNFLFEFWFSQWRDLSAYIVPVVASAFFLAVMAFMYWIWFEISYNIERKKDIYYIGNTAIMDQLARKIFSNGKQLFLVKLLGLTISEIMFYAWIFHES